MVCMWKEYLDRAWMVGLVYGTCCLRQQGRGCMLHFNLTLKRPDQSLLPLPSYLS